MGALSYTVSMMDSAYIYKRIKTVTDLAALIRVYGEVFEVAEFALPKQEHLQFLLNNPANIYLAAVSEGRIVGGFTAYVLSSVYSEKPELYLYDLAVLAAFQRHGIGTRLLQALKEIATELNASEIFVQADFEDDGALAFYRATGGAEENVRHFVYPIP